MNDVQEMSDVERAAAREIADALEPLPEETRARVLRYFAARYGINASEK